MTSPICENIVNSIVSLCSRSSCTGHVVIADCKKLRSTILECTAVAICRYQISLKSVHWLKVETRG
jgi:hypothetical protein